MSDQLATAPPREIQLFEPPADALYTIEATAQLLDVPRRAIVRYCRYRLLKPAFDPARVGYYFNRDGIRRLRRIEELRPRCRETLGAIKVMLDLMDEMERLQRQNFSRPQSANGKRQSGTANKKEKT